MRITPSLIAPVVLAVALTATLSACASDGTRSRYSQDMDRLTAECTAREGILQPTGATSGEAARDYACVIRGGATRIN